MGWRKKEQLFGLRRHIASHQPQPNTEFRLCGNGKWNALLWRLVSKWDKQSYDEKYRPSSIQGQNNTYTLIIQPASLLHEAQKSFVSKRVDCGRGRASVDGQKYERYYFDS